MKIEFECVSKGEVKIVGIVDGERRTIGQIFTPSGSGHNKKDSIQVCGFSKAFDLWGCGVFADKGVQVKDIQLKFTPTTEPHALNRIIKHDAMGFETKNELPCLRCYNNPCTCERALPYSVVRSNQAGMVD